MVAKSPPLAIEAPVDRNDTLGTCPCSCVILVPAAPRAKVLSTTVLEDAPGPVLFACAPGEVVAKSCISEVVLPALAVPVLLVGSSVGEAMAEVVTLGSAEDASGEIGRLGVLAVDPVETPEAVDPFDALVPFVAADAGLAYGEACEAACGACMQIPLLHP